MPNPNIADEGKNYQFKEGQTGNPQGRPRGKSVSTILKELLDGEIKNTEGITKTRSEVIALKLFEKAIKNGDLKAITEILDRTEGKAPQTLNVNTPNKNPLAGKTDQEIEDYIKRIEGGSTEPTEAGESAS